jgi:hypothetical protein
VFPSKLKWKISKVKKGLKELKEKLLQQLREQVPPQKAVETLNSIYFCHKHPRRPLLGMLFLFLQKKDALLAF